MIEDKELGLKIAEDSEEALWFKVKKESAQLIKMSEDNLIIQKAMNELADAKLKPYEKK